MRIFLAGIATETNTFAPFPTGWRGFEEGGLHRGDATRNDPGVYGEIARTWRGLAEKDGHTVVEGLIASAQPSGKTVRSVYESMRDEILAQLERDGPFDVVLLGLHGAMIADGYDDCEGDLIQRARAIVGPTVKIGVELDPHCHLTDAMVQGATAIVLMKEYPHSDYVPRAQELYAICVGAAAGTYNPVSAVVDLRMVGFYPTTAEPMASLLQTFFAAEKERGVLSASFAHGFPWADMVDVGSKMLVIADGDERLAFETAKSLAARIYDAREKLLPRYPKIDAAIDQAIGLPGLVVLADTADNPGGGSPGDDTRLLAALRARKLDRIAIGCFWDPVLAQTCAEAGVGARFDMRLGGKAGPSSGAPIDLVGTVRAIEKNHTQGGLGPSRSAMGLSVWIEADDMDIVICSKRTQTFSPDAFTGLGIDLSTKRFVVVKSSQHFHALFAPIADAILQVATPGALQMDFASMPYTKRDANYFPRVADPQARN
ncbi:M81 family metallopeptidase [Roseiterribacter gracilis]|uniref:Microcystinase C n=1 Tax=Roseiterribacter gracilis TaxID=2812848 RepID=A0A8S8XAQ2_9PROT|nr:microcystinase C [Rhodospirillales bacterium TMPK1]